MYVYVYICIYVSIRPWKRYGSHCCHNSLHFSQFCEADASLLSLWKQPKPASNLFQRGARIWQKRKRNRTREWRCYESVKSQKLNKDRRGSFRGQLRRSTLTLTSLSRLLTQSIYSHHEAGRAVSVKPPRLGAYEFRAKLSASNKNSKLSPQKP